jgi:protein TonB
LFDHFIAATKPSWKRRALIMLSLGLHAGVGLALLVISIFHVEELAPPTVTVTFFSAPPPPPPPPPAARKAVEHKPKVPKVVRAPTEIPQLVQPPRPEEPEPEEEPDQGVEGGVEGGVPGGVVGGVLGGVPQPPKPRPQLDDSQVKLTKISGPDPTYTDKALEQEIEGQMQVKCVVTEQGAVHGCRVVKSLPFMDRAAIDALERRKYQPYLLNGKPTEIDYTFKITLRLPR